MYKVAGGLPRWVEATIRALGKLRDVLVACCKKPQVAIEPQVAQPTMQQQLGAMQQGQQQQLLRIEQLENQVQPQPQQQQGVPLNLNHVALPSGQGTSWDSMKERFGTMQ
ncbi:hypothetical protein PG997_006683 [Apiospora hydei]|uniref:Uncharacterized protein n=1 Tax=Apiospora hydei TaxID=1337664 RepID=A0ABR1WPE4_9PEZI